MQLKQADFGADERRMAPHNDAEAAVDESPVYRDAADGTGDQREEEDADGADEAEVDPLVATGFSHGPMKAIAQGRTLRRRAVGAIGEEADS